MTEPPVVGNSLLACLIVLQNINCENKILNLNLSFFCCENSSNVRNTSYWWMVIDLILACLIGQSTLAYLIVFPKIICENKTFNLNLSFLLL